MRRGARARGVCERCVRGRWAGAHIARERWSRAWALDVDYQVFDAVRACRSAFAAIFLQRVVEWSSAARSMCSACMEDAWGACARRPRRRRGRKNAL